MWVGHSFVPPMAVRSLWSNQLRLNTERQAGDGGEGGLAESLSVSHSPKIPASCSQVCAF